MNTHYYTVKTSFIVADVDFDVTYDVESHYEIFGEDADGNRGVMREYIDNFEIDKVSIDGVEKIYEKLHKDIQNVIDTHVDKELNS